MRNGRRLIWVSHGDQIHRCWHVPYAVPPGTAVCGYHSEVWSDHVTGEGSKCRLCLAYGRKRRKPKNRDAGSSLVRQPVG